jgi:hypothetical protein
LKNSKLKTLYPWWIPSSKPFILEEFQAQNPLPPEEFHGSSDIKSVE